MGGQPGNDIVWIGFSYDSLDPNNYRRLNGSDGGVPDLPHAGDTLTVDWHLVWLLQHYTGGKSLGGDITSFGILDEIRIQFGSEGGWCDLPYEGDLTSFEGVGVDASGSPNPLRAKVLHEVKYSDVLYLRDYSGGGTWGVGTSYFDFESNVSYAPILDTFTFRGGKVSISGCMDNFIIDIDQYGYLNHPDTPGELHPEQYSTVNFISNNRTGPTSTNGVRTNLEAVNAPSYTHTIQAPLYVSYQPQERFIVPDKLVLGGWVDMTTRVPFLNEVRAGDTSFDPLTSALGPTNLLVAIPSDPEDPTAISLDTANQSVGVLQGNPIYIDSLSANRSQWSDGSTSGNRTPHIYLPSGVTMGDVDFNDGQVMFLGGYLPSTIRGGRLGGGRTDVSALGAGQLLIGESYGGDGSSDSSGEVKTCGVHVVNHRIEAFEHTRTQWWSDEIVPVFSFIKITWVKNVPTDIDPSGLCCR